MSESLTPPPRRPAPEELRTRIAADLARAEGRGSQRARVLVAIAAALVLVAGVGGVLGATRSDGHQDLVPVERPSPTSTGATQKPRVSPTPRTTPSAQPEILRGEPMTAAQIRRDTKSCTTPDPQDADPVPRQGSLRTTYASVQPLVTNSTSPVSERVLFVRDDVGQFECIDGQESRWSSLPTQSFEPTAKLPGGEVPNSGGGTSASCGKGGDARVDSEVMLQVDAHRVAAARVTVVSDGQAVRVVDVPVDGPLLYLPVRLSGAAARLPMSFGVQLQDDKGHVLTVQPYGEAGTKPTDRLAFTMESCADTEKRMNQHKPKALTLPTSDRAGVASCLKMVKQDSAQPLDVDKAKAEVTISTTTEWGAVLSDGAHTLGCSLYPTEELSAAEPVTNPVTTKKAFFWAANPIPTGGETLWAAGLLPEVTKIIYQLPNGTTTSAKINSAGYWMVKARTDTEFGTKPVTVTVTRRGQTTTYTIPWNADTQCNQVSHGC